MSAKLFVENSFFHNFLVILCLNLYLLYNEQSNN